MKTSNSILNFQKKCGLFWEEKPEAIELVLANQKLYLAENKPLGLGENGPEHRLFEGDNLLGLHYLKQSREQFDLIYIDPPYNTGNKDFKYNDHYVDEEDELRHSKWISFMYKRLLLAKELLTEDGAIFLSIDDYEQARLKLLCDGIFGQQNFVANFIRKCKAGSGHDSKQVAVEYDYVLCYAKNINKLEFAKAEVDVESDKKYRYSDDFVKKRGKYYLRDLDYRGSYSKSMDYLITAPDGSKIKSGGKVGKPNTWRWNKEKFDWGLKHDFIEFKQRKEGWKVYIKQYQYVDNQDKKRIRKLPHRALLAFSNAKGSNELKDILPEEHFTYPKPTDLIRFFMELMDKKEARVLDFFAGSGSSLHATMLQNQADGGKRRCTLITNNENGICRKITYPRNKNVIQGYQKRSGKKVAALSQNQLRYFQLKLKDA
ncbi:MAG: site-specific DNA-methyltransferase [Vicingaceae bacterium]